MALTIRFLILALLALLQTVPAAAAAIRYQAVDLADTTPGEDRWRYRYMPDYDFNAGEGFTIYFAPALYSDLSNAKPVSHSDWSSVMLVQPDMLSSLDGFYDVLALVVHASTAAPFEVDFTWRGLGAPGSQQYEIYSTNGPGGFDVLASGFTSEAAAGVPEPMTLVLTGTALLALSALRRGR